MDNKEKEQEAARERVRGLSYQREAEHGSFQAKHKPAFRTPEEEAHQKEMFELMDQQVQQNVEAQQKKRQQQALQKAAIDLQKRRGAPVTGNAISRVWRLRTASEGQPPVFNENIWNQFSRGPRDERDGSISPKTRIEKDEAMGMPGGGRGNIHQSSEAARVNANSANINHSFTARGGGNIQQNFGQGAGRGSINPGYANQGFPARGVSNAQQNFGAARENSGSGRKSTIPGYVNQSSGADASCGGGARQPAGRGPYPGARQQDNTRRPHNNGSGGSNNTEFSGNHNQKQR